MKFYQYLAFLEVPSSFVNISYFCSLTCYREHDKKVCCLGLTSLLANSGNQFPGDALGHIFKATLDLLVAYKDQLAGLSSSLCRSLFFFSGFCPCI